MKLSVDRSELAEALGVANSVAASRTPKPILQCVLIEACKDHLEMSATDLEMSVRFVVSKAQIEQPGSVVVHADKLGQIVRESNDDVLKIEVSGDQCHIRGEDSHFQVFTREVGDFPPVTKPGEDYDFEIGVSDLRRLTEWTVFAAARENTRYAINGVLWDKRGVQLSLVATDGRRLSKACCVLEGKEADLSGIVPTKAMQVLSRVLTEPESKVRVQIAPNQIVFQSSNAMLSASLLEGHFPKYEDVIPDDCDKTVVFDTQALLSAVRRAALLSNDESKGVKLSFGRGLLTLSSRSPEQGEAVVELPIDYTGDDFVIGFNPLFIVDVLRAVSSDRVSFEFKEPNRPGVFRRGELFLSVIMPVSLS